MGINQDAMEWINLNLGKEMAARMFHLASGQERIEAQNRSDMEAAFKVMDRVAIQGLLDHGAFDSDRIEEILQDVLASNKARSIRKVLNEERPRVRLAKGKPPKYTRKSFMQIMQEYDLWRKKKKISARERELARRIKEDYLKRVKSVWEKHSEAFRAGEQVSKEEISERIRKAADTAYARAKMITETETTRHYNETRRGIYDASPDVTHYLFIAIRDKRTTKWCKTRDRLVYSKDDPLLDLETPPIHWNCRSEILPLTELIAAHLALINKRSSQRRNHSPEPLPKGWNRS